MGRAAMHFAPSFAAFFRALAQNNDTTWFAANRKAYEQDVKRPFEAFATAMIARIAAVDPEVKIAAKDAISRINRDTRFGTDKRPYHTHLSAAISKHGKKDKEYPGVLFRLSHEGIAVFGGVYAPEPPTLAAVRALIAKDGKAFRKAITGKAFVAHFGALRGEALKRVPPDLQAAVKAEPLVANKQFFYEAQLPASLLTKPDLGDVLMAHWQASREVNVFLQRAFR
jgi:uncharacterized protein (TIGR02453 family)